MDKQFDKYVDNNKRMTLSLLELDYKPRRFEIFEKFIDEEDKTMTLALKDLDYKPTDDNDDNDIIIATAHIENDVLSLSLGESCLFNYYKIKNYELLIMIYDDFHKIFNYMLDEIMYLLTFDGFAYL